MLRIGTMPNVAAAQQAAFCGNNGRESTVFSKSNGVAGGGEPIVLQLLCVVATRVASRTERRVRTCKPNPMACRSHLASNGCNRENDWVAPCSTGTATPGSTHLDRLHKVTLW
jgi:hypothetical protein